MTLIFLTISKAIRCPIILFLPILFLLYPRSALSEETIDDALKPDEELEEELKYLKAETYVITPSKIPQRIEKAPGTIHVVTDKQIRQMGARYLVDVVQTVPGWYVREVYQGNAEVFVNGSSGPGSNRILFMVNSHPVNSVRYGSAIDLYSYLDLDNVKRIEFVSGPGSALYGSGAMAGIINIITKGGEDVDGLQLTGRGGSFNTWEGNALFGKTVGDLEVAAYADYRNSGGFRGHVEQDQQSLWDPMGHTHASLAPGSMKGGSYQWDAQLTLKYKGLKFDGKYINRKWDMPFGNRPILDNMSDLDVQQYYLNLSYDVTVTEGLDIMAKAYRNQCSSKTLQEFWPKGAVMWVPPPQKRVILSENKFGEWRGKSSRMGAEAQATYEIVAANTIVGGITFEEQNAYDNAVKGNYMLTSNPFEFIPLPTVQDWPDKDVFPTKKRDFWAAYVEDIWDIRDDLRLTIGGRYDHYSDFGGQFSPRVGVNWEFFQDYYTKFLYGRAFRAPNFEDLYAPYRGNPDLKPETLDAYELSLGGRFRPSLSGQITFFHKRAKDLIATELVLTVPPISRFANLSTATSEGVVLQIKYDFGRGTYLGLNYTQMNMDIRNPDQRVWFEPKRLGTLTGNIRLNRYLNLNAELLYRGGWTRPDGDQRSDPGDYAIVNATLIAKNFVKELKGLEVRGSVLNLFNKDYTSPTGLNELPDDLPMPGINFFLELRYTF